MTSSTYFQKGWTFLKSVGQEFRRLDLQVLGKKTTEVRCPSHRLVLWDMFCPYSWITGDANLDRLVKVESAFSAVKLLLFSLHILHFGRQLTLKGIVNEALPLEGRVYLQN